MERLINMAEVKKITCLGSTKIYKDIKTGDFPKPVKIGAASRWVASEIEAWITKTIVASRKIVG